jgi:FlaG/FlaF family flagellin (archaellin)
LISVLFHSFFSGKSTIFLLIFQISEFMMKKKAQTSVEFLLLLAAVLVTLAGILAYFVTSSSSMGSSVSGEVENTRQEASNILKSHSSAFRNPFSGRERLGVVKCSCTAD